MEKTKTVENFINWQKRKENESNHVLPKNKGDWVVSICSIESTYEFNK